MTTPSSSLKMRSRERDHDSPVSPSNSLTKWMDENGYASEGAVKSCMGVRPTRRHASVRPVYPAIRGGYPTYVLDERYSGVHLDRYTVAIEELEKELAQVAETNEILDASFQMRQSKIHSSLASLACIMSSPEAVEVKNVNNVDAFGTQVRRTSRTTSRKRQSRLSSLKCIAGGAPKVLEEQLAKEDTQEDTDEWTDEDSYQGEDWFAEPNDAKVQPKRVTFTFDNIDEPKDVRSPTELMALDEREQLRRDVAKLQSDLEELQLLNCLDDVEAWLGIHDRSLQNVIRHGMAENKQNGYSQEE